MTMKPPDSSPAALDRRSVDLRFLDPALPVEERVQVLVTQMTLREKIAQLLHSAPLIPRFNVHKEIIQ